MVKFYDDGKGTETDLLFAVFLFGLMIVVGIIWWILEATAF